MTEISNAIDKAINLSDMAIETSGKIDDIDTRGLIIELKGELINARMALKIRKAIDRRLPLINSCDYGKLLDALY
jgi:hypothetical protein